MTKSIANWIACVQVHSFARHFHIYFRFSLQVSETFTIFAPDYNYHSMNGLEGNGYQRHISLYRKGVCVVQGKQDFPVILSSDYLAVPNNLLLSLS